MNEIINITKSAEEYLAKLIQDKNETDLSIRIFISDPGTPKAETCLAYCKPEEAMPAVHELMRDLPEDDEGTVEKTTEARLQRVHRNLGHPSNRLLVQISKEAKAPDSVVEVAKNLQCSICARHVRTSPARPANPFRARELGHTVAMGFSYHTTPNREN